MRYLPEKNNLMLFNATGGWAIRWKYVLAKYKYCTASVRRACGYIDDITWKEGCLILDSGMSKDDKIPLTHEKLVKRGIEIGVDMLIPIDILDNCGKTIESIKEFFVEWGNLWMTKLNKQVLIPLQRPYEECFEALKNYGDHFALGGLVSLKDKGVQFECIRQGTEILAQAGKSCHLLGIYPNTQLLSYLYSGASIHSLDTSVCETNAKHGVILDIELNPYHIEATRGEYSTPIKHKLAELNCIVLDQVINHSTIGKKTNGKGGTSIFLKKRNLKYHNMNPQARLDKID